MQEALATLKRNPFRNVHEAKPIYMFNFPLVLDLDYGDDVLLA